MLGGRRRHGAKAVEVRLDMRQWKVGQGQVECRIGDGNGMKEIKVVKRK